MRHSAQLRIGTATWWIVLRTGADLRVVGGLTHVLRTSRVFSNKRMHPRHFAEMFPAIGNPISQDWPELVLTGWTFLHSFNEFVGNLIPDSACFVVILKSSKLNPQNRFSLNKAPYFQ
jgi:hypothetical protein